MSNGCGDRRERGFAELWQAIVQSYEAGAFEPALALVDEAIARFPDPLDWWQYTRICLLAVSGDIERALDQLDDALDQGHWWSPRLLEDGDLDALRDSQRFRRSAALAVARWRSANDSATGDVRVIEPDARARGVLVALHGTGPAALGAIDRWTSAAAHGWIVVVPVSSQRLCPTIRCWDDTLKGTREVLHRLNAFRDAHDPTGTTVFGGVSAGAQLALSVALEQRTVDGAIAMAPTLAGLEVPARTATSVWITIGDHDPAWPYVADTQKRLVNAGCAVRVDARPGLGHRDPPDLDTTLADALDWIALQPPR